MTNMKPKPFDRDDDLIVELGASVVAVHLGVSRQAVSKWWHKNAIPLKWRPKLKAFAEQQGHSVVADWERRGEA